jgi:hypothetical protein
MRQDIEHLDVFEKMDFVKTLLRNRFPEIDDSNQMAVTLCRLSHYASGKYKAELTDRERILLDLLLKEDINCSTLYKWYLLTRSPSDVKMKLRKGIISQKQAFRMNANRKRVKELTIGLELMEEARTFIRGL